MMMYNDESLRILIRRLGDQHGSVAEWSKSKDLHPEQVYQFLRGKKRAEPRILDALGLERVITYAPKGPTETSSALLPT